MKHYSIRQSEGQEARDDFNNLVSTMQDDLMVNGLHLESGQWHAQSVNLVAIEERNVVIEMAIPNDRVGAGYIVQPNMPWAEEHFLERVGGIPVNPPPSSSHWPHAQSDNAVHKALGIFSHTYPERFWPKRASYNGRKLHSYGTDKRGIRFNYGDYMDVIRQLDKDQNTRQAYLPIFFPEDTGAIEGQRVPCSLGYQFMIRDGYLHVNYFMRSCDIMRHFRDDIYMALRLAQHTRSLLNGRADDRRWGIITDKINREGHIYPGQLTMFISSLHMFEPDVPILMAQRKAQLRKGKGNATKPE